MGLEIGPSHEPIAPKLKGFGLHIFNHASAVDLRNKYQGYAVNLNNIEEVDFVWHGEPLHELIGKTRCYDWIVASHVIEHVQNFISYLQQYKKLLKPEGILSLIIPDKRYYFDYFSSSCSTGNILDAFTEKRVRPSHGQIFDHIANASKHYGNIASGLDDQGGEDEIVHSFPEAQAHWVHSLSSTDFIDAHNWRFTPSSFRLVICDLLNLDLIGLEIKAEFDTVGSEFYVSFSRKVALPLN